MNSNGYGIEFNVSGNASVEMSNIEKSMNRLTRTVTAGTNQIESNIDQMGERFKKIQDTIATVFAVAEVKRFGEEILHVTAEFEGFDNRIKYASMNTVDAANNMSFLRREVDQLHLPIRQVMEGFSEMEAGLKGTGIEGSRLRNLFEGISTAAATLHLPQYQLQRTLYDLKEIGEIGLNARIERSLGTALPGIGGIVKDTFGKSMHDLQKDGMSGAKFLDKLGPALTKQFASGLAAYGDSLQAKMADTSNKFIAMQIDMGEKLKPVYISIMDTLISLMGKVGQFVGYLNDHSAALGKLFNVVETLIIAYGVYKTMLGTVSIAQAVYTAALTASTVASYAAEFGTQGLIFALGELGVSITTLGLGALAIGIGAIIKYFIDWNSELDKTVDKISNLKDISNQFGQNTKTYENLVTTYNAYLKDPSRFTTGEVQSLAVGMKDLYDQEHKALVGSVTPSFQKTQEALHNLPKPDTTYSPMGVPVIEKNLQYGKTESAADSLGSILDITNLHLDVLNKALKTPAISKALITSGKATYDPTSDTALHSLRLSGAQGGLGQAKVINIKIGEVMHVENHDNKNLVHHAEMAAEQIIRVANNFSESQSGTY